MIFVPFFFASLLWSWVVAFPTMSDVQADSTSMVENSTNTFHYEAIQTMQNRWQKFWADSKHFNNRYTHTFDNGSSLTVPREELFRILNPDNITTVIVNNTVTTLWADGTPLIDENDPCHMRSYELYKEYTNKECTPPNQFAPNGVDCNVHNGTLTHCIDFCQVRTTYYYGTEIPIRGPNPNPGSKFPYEVSWCHGKKEGMDCHLESATSIEIQPLPAPDGGSFNDVYNYGLSSGYEPVQHTLHAFPGWNNKRLFNDQCGYWTFLPIVQTVCGSRSEALEGLDPRYPGECLAKLPGDIVTSGNICVDQYVQRISQDGKKIGIVEGKTVWVSVDCYKLLAYPTDQNEDYKRDRVALYRDDLTKILDDWKYLWCDFVTDRGWYYWGVGRVFKDDDFGDYGVSLKSKFSQEGNCRWGRFNQWTFEYDYNGQDGDHWDFQYEYHKYARGSLTAVWDRDNCVNPTWLSLGVRDEHVCWDKGIH